MSRYFFEKVAKSSLSEAEDIMASVYEENPSYWPHGLNKEAMDGGLYLIRETNTSQPVGFVGWQDRYEDMRKVGYYSIGIKKEHRRKGFAKKAVAEIIRRKSATVDQVKAYIVDSNKPSINLAEKLEVPILLEKSAGMMRNLAGLGAGMAGIGAGGVAGGYFGDKISDTGEFLDKNVGLNKLLNQAAGAALMAPALLFSPGIRRTKGMPVGLAAMSGQNLVSWPMKEGLIGYKDTQDRFINSQQELTDTNLETAKTEERSAQIQEDTSQIYRDLISKYGGAALAGGGLLGLAAVIAMYKNKGSGGRGGPGVLSVDIPENQMSEKFYKTLSRDLLFDSPKEKKRKLEMLLANSGNDPMVQKLLTNKSASFKKKAANDEGFEKSAWGWLRPIGTALVNRARGAPRAAVNSVKRIPGNLKNTATVALPQTIRGIAGRQGGNWAGKAIRNSAITNAGLNVGLTGLDKATGWDTAQTHRDWLFDPFKDAAHNYKQWWNATPEEREDNNYLRNALLNTIWAPANLAMGAGVGGSVARMGMAVPRFLGTQAANAGKGLLSRYGGQAAVAPGSTNLLAQTGRGIRDAYKGLDKSVMNVINSGQRVGQAAGQGFARSLGMNPASKLGASTSMLGGLTATSPWELFRKGQAGRFLYQNFARNLAQGGTNPGVAKAIANFGRGNNWWNKGLKGQKWHQKINPLSFAGGHRLPNLAYQIPHVAGGAGKMLAGAIPSFNVGTYMGAPSFSSGTGIDLDERTLGKPGGFTQDLTDWHNSLNEWAPNVMKLPGWMGGDGEATMGLGDVTTGNPFLSGYIPGMPTPMQFGDQTQGGADIHFGDSPQTGYAGRHGMGQKGEDPAFLGFFTAHDQQDKIRSGAYGSTNVKDHSWLDETALKYPPTLQGYQDYLDDKDNPHQKMKEEPEGGLQTFANWMGANPLTTAQGMPTEARQRYRTRVFDAFLKRRRPQQATTPVYTSDNPILEKIMENLPAPFGYTQPVQPGNIR